jgi:RNA polymerase sigma-70 factor (ECF subfamily)
MAAAATAGTADQRDGDILGLLRANRQAEAFDALLNRYESKIYRLCCSLLRNDAQAEDAAQESLVRIWKGLGGYDGRASLSTWIYTIARNRCFTAMERRRDEDSMSDEAVAQQAEVATAVPASDGDDHLAVLRELVDALPERFSRVLRLFYYEDRSISEVATMLGVPEGTVKTNLFRGRAMLLQRLRQLGLADAGLWLEASV